LESATSMNSSTSSSDLAYGRCLVACFATLGLGALLILILMMAVDPYDSGRFGWLGIAGVADKIALTANASRARDPHFDSAIFGDSTGQLLNPARLSEATGARFVQLVAPGADPRGHLATLDFFLRHHQHVGALVLVIDRPWCTHELAQRAQNPFPFWLYSGNALEYAGRLFSWSAIDRLAQRIAIGLGVRERMNPDGFWSYEEVWPPGQKQPVIGPWQEPRPLPGTVSDGFPVEALLGDEIRKLPADVPVVLLMPPTFYTIVPPPGSRAAVEHEACRTAFRRVVAGRPRSNFIDYRVDNALTRDPANFADLVHYRARIARKMEDGIAASIRLGEAAKIDF
jgi:hypothetical protein